MRVWLAVVALGFLLAACGAAGPTPTVTPLPGCAASNGKQVYNLLETYAGDWEKAANRADAAQPAAMAPEIEALQKIRQDLNAQQWPACGKAAQAAFVALMDTTIEGFTAEMNLKPRAESNAILERTRAQKETFQAEVQKLPR